MRAVREEPPGWWLVIDAPTPTLLRYVALKGSIAVDGVSLTVAERRRARLRGRDHPAHVGGDDRSATTGPGSEVNLEVDLVARYLERLREGGSREEPQAEGRARRRATSRGAARARAARAREGVVPRDDPRIADVEAAIADIAPAA